MTPMTLIKTAWAPTDGLRYRNIDLEGLEFSVLGAPGEPIFDANGALVCALCVRTSDANRVTRLVADLVAAGGVEDHACVTWRRTWDFVLGQLMRAVEAATPGEEPQLSVANLYVFREPRECAVVHKNHKTGMWEISLNATSHAACTPQVKCDACAEDIERALVQRTWLDFKSGLFKRTPLPEEIIRASKLGSEAHLRGVVAQQQKLMFDAALGLTLPDQPAASMRAPWYRYFRVGDSEKAREPDVVLLHMRDTLIYERAVDDVRWELLNHMRVEGVHEHGPVELPSCITLAAIARDLVPVDLAKHDVSPDRCNEWYVVGLGAVGLRTDRKHRTLLHVIYLLGACAPSEPCSHTRLGEADALVAPDLC
jgi:hypothetical protein